MPGSESESEKRSRTAALDCLRNGERRLVLGAIVDRGTPVTERELAADLAARDGPAPTGGADGTGTTSAHIELRHVHLPALADAGLVAWDEGENTVTSTDSSMLEDPRIEALLEVDDDRVVAAVADDRRREVLACLEGRGEVTTAALAREIATPDAGGEPAVDAADRLALRLHHAHLPTLEEAGFVDYDPDERTVSRREPPEHLPDGLLTGRYFEAAEQSDPTPQIKIP